MFLLWPSQLNQASAENDYHDNCRAQWEAKTVTHCPGWVGRGNESPTKDTWHRTCRHSRKPCLHILNSVRFISRPSLLLYFAEFSNYINQKKNEINKKQEGARKLLLEFTREIKDSCQGKKRRILRKPEQRARARRLLDNWTVVVPDIRYYLGSPRMGKALK